MTSSWATMLCFLLLAIPSFSYAGGSPWNVPVRDHRNKQTVTVLLFGDSGTGKDAQYDLGRVMADVCQSQRCDLALGAGDNIYEFGAHSVSDPRFETYFEMPYLRFGRFDFWMTLGNHDYLGSVSAQIANSYYSDMWRMPARHYEVPLLPEWLHFYGLDTNVDGGPAVATMRQSFCQRTGWKGIFGHHPIYSNGGHGGSFDSKLDYYPLIKDCGIQFFFGGHDHHQEHITGDGFEQIIQGAAAKERAVTQRPYEPGSGQWQRFAVTALGFGIIRFTRELAVMNFYDSTGKVIYSWSATQDQIGKLPELL